MKIAQLRWLQMIMILMRGIRGVAFKYIITNTPTPGDITRPSHPFSLVKKPIAGSRSVVVWRGNKEALQDGETVHLLELQEILSEDLFSKFILILATEKIRASKKKKNNYWIWEAEDTILDDPQALLMQIMESFPQKRIPEEIPASAVESRLQIAA